ncbi:MAG: hypothetical protein F6K09_20845 [Merismopedia sp. SIO2A8]|nr:hypothetical protein [Merismopedia sp. SIO2A8]
MMTRLIALTEPSQADESLLQDRDYTIIMAKTLPNPMAAPPGFAQRWMTAQASILDLAQKCREFDPDGITLYVATATEEASEKHCLFQCHEQADNETFESILNENQAPQSLYLADGLEAALNAYFTDKANGTAKINGQIILILLDGEPLDRIAIANLIVKATHQIDSDEELGIGFIQIGENPIAQGFFAMLDDHLEEAGAKYDIVHTQILETIETDSLSTFLLHTILD